jgi:hypothetical protein
VCHLKLRDRRSRAPGPCQSSARDAVVVFISFRVVSF